MSKIISDTIQGRSKDPNVNAGFTISGVTTVTEVINANSDVRISGNLNAGIVTVTSISGNGSGLSNVGVDTATVDASTLQVSGISTFKNELKVTAGGIEVDGGGLDIAGVSTFAGVVSAGSDVRVTGNLNAGITTTSSLINDTALSHRNILINGDMLLAQRSTSAVSTTISGPNYATLDRWLTWAGSASKFSVQQVADAPSGFKYSLKALSLGANADEGYQAIGQRIESANITQLNLGTAYAKPFTLSFWVRSSLTGTFTGYIHGVSSFQPSYVYTYTISIADTWEKKVINVPAATIGSGKFGSGGVEAGLEIGFTLSGNGYKTANANTWVNETYKLEVTGLTSVDITGTNAATFYVTGVQLEAGSVATPFEHRSFGETLSLCQRYYQVGSSIGAGYGSADGYARAGSVYATQMRATPSFAATNTGSGSIIATGTSNTGFYVTYGSLGGSSAGIFSFTAQSEI